MKIKWLVAASGGGIVGLLLSILIGWWLWPVQYYNTDIVDLKPHHKEDYIFMVGAAYVLTGDLESARERLAFLEMPHVEEYVARLAESYIAKGANPDEVRPLVILAQALGKGTEEMLAYVATATPTSTPTITLTPTSTPLPSPTPTVTETPTATITPKPPTPSAIPIPILSPSPTPPLPTDTPAPTLDFRVATQRILTIHENKGCRGNHILTVIVVDKEGNPLNDVVLTVSWPGGMNEVISGAKEPGILEFEMHGAHQVQVTRDISGRTYTSEATRWLDSVNPQVPDLIDGEYCTDEADCQLKKEEGKLCEGHYSYEVVFQRQW